LSQHVHMASKSSDLFLMGLLSVTDAMLDRPLHEILAYLPVSNSVRQALCGGAGSEFATVYALLLSYERADWAALSAAAKQLNCCEEQIAPCYLSAADRANSIVG